MSNNNVYSITSDISTNKLNTYCRGTGWENNVFSGQYTTIKECSTACSNDTTCNAFDVSLNTTRRYPFG